MFGDVVNEGGHLYLSDMFRSAVQQQKAHEDWKSGRKSAFSPPSCSSVHEAARAIDIDAFDTAIGVTGLALTKLDGTAKGGVIAAIAHSRAGRTPIPVRFIGVGEGIDDLRPFVAEDFVTALLDA